MPTEPPTVPAGPGSPAFAGALRAAVERSGLGLVRLRHHVGRRGLTVSTATLSHWQTGRSVPERSTSLLVVDALEDVLGLAPGDLRSLVPGPRPRGRDAEVTLPDEAGRRALPHFDQIAAAAADLSSELDDALRVMTSHQVAEIGPERTVTRHVVRQVMRAVTDRADRLVLFTCDEAPHADLPTVVPRIGCATGERRHQPELGLTTTELLLPRPLLAGERWFVEYEVEHVPVDLGSLELRMTHRVREAVVLARFHPEAGPVVVTARHDDAGTVHDSRVLPDPDGWASVVRHDLRPGGVGLHWTWPGG